VASELERQGGMTLTDQVRIRIQDAIYADEFGVTGRLPSERRLAVKYGVGRMPIRGALRDLMAQGMIQIEPGVGAFVSKKTKLDAPLGRLWSFTEEALARGQSPRSRVLETAVILASLDLASVFGVREGTQLVRISRVRMADGVPMGLEIAHLPRPLFPGIETHDFGTESLYTTLHESYGIRPTRARQTIEAAEPSAQEQELLELAPHIPVLRVSRISATDDDQVIEYVRGSWRADRSMLTIEIGYPDQLLRGQLTTASPDITRRSN
jgi:GntR family transcriptional regulator